MELLSNYKIHISLEAVVVAIIFGISLINSVMLIVSSIIVCVFLIIYNQKSIGAIKALIFISIRSILSLGIAPSYDSYGIIKWLIIFLLSLLLVFAGFNIGNKLTKQFLILISCFALYVVISGFITSGYPIISSFKVFSWIFVFCAIIIGVSNNPYFEWIKYVCNYLNYIIIFSPFAFVLGIAYLKNGHAFQGILNHPNMLGIITSLAFALNLHLIKNKWSMMRLFIMVLCFVECLLTESRTGAITIIICFFVSLFLGMEKGWKKVLLIVVVSFLCLILLLSGIEEDILSYLYKGQSVGNLLYSRENQIARAIEKFQANELFGSGFMVPINYSGKSYTFSFDLLVEPGNIIATLLGDIGIVGTIFFCIPYGLLATHLNKRDILLFVTPFMASMGEMLFFSTNNVAIIYYLMFAVCLTRNKSDEFNKINFIK